MPNSTIKRTIWINHMPWQEAYFLPIWYNDNCWFIISWGNTSSVKTLMVENGQHAFSTKQHQNWSVERKIPSNNIHINAIEVTCSSFLPYSLLMSKTNSTALGFTRSGGMSAILAVASAVVLLLRIAWNCNRAIKLWQAKRTTTFKKSNEQFNNHHI